MILQAAIFACALIIGAVSVKGVSYVSGGGWQGFLLLASFLAVIVAGYLVVFWAETSQAHNDRVGSFGEAFARMGSGLWSVFIGILRGLGGVWFAAIGWMVGYLAGGYIWRDREGSS